MDCFNNFCPFRENTTSNLNRCECVACTNRCHEKYTYNPPISKKKCFNCGWNDYINTENGWVDYYIVERCVPVQSSDSAFENSACKYCSNNPRNGGSGICHCIMGSPEIR